MPGKGYNPKDANSAVCVLLCGLTVGFSWQSILCHCCCGCGIVLPRILHSFSRFVFAFTQL